MFFMWAAIIFLIAILAAALGTLFATARVPYHFEHL